MISKVSVLIPTFNRSNYIEECLDSVFAQTLPPLEVIVIDDGSDDDTAEVLKRYKDRINYIYKENGGKPSALNIGLKQAKGEYIWLFDDDDVALPDSIFVRQTYLENHPDIGFVFTNHYWGKDDASGHIAKGHLYNLPAEYTHSVFPELLKGCSFTLQSVLARKSVYDAVGLFDETLVSSEDYDMLVRMTLHASGVAINTPSFIFRQHDGIRGPKTHRYSGGNERIKTFKQFDQAVGKKIRASLPLNLYRNLSETISPDSIHLVELLSRMLIMSSKGLVAEMLEDLHQVISNCENTTTSEINQLIERYCKQSVYTGYATEALLDNWSLFYVGLSNIPVCSAKKHALKGFAKGFFIKAKSYPGSVRDKLLWLYRSACCYSLLLKS